jgi:hypothetical protein
MMGRSGIEPPHFSHCQRSIASCKTAFMRLSQVFIAIAIVSMLASCASKPRFTKPGTYTAANAKPEPKKRETLPKSLKWTSTIDRF